MPLDRKKKREERFEIENLLTSIRGEFGDEVKVMEKEPPDFIVRLPDGTDIGIEATKCCPSKARGEHNNMTDYQWMEDVERMFMQNEYFREKTANYGMNILIDGSVEIRRSRNSKEECCKEIEAHLRQLLDSEEHQDQPTRLIRRVRILQGNGLSTTVQFNHIARRDAIMAKELLKTIEKKNKKFSHYDSVCEVWLSIYLPWQENRHPYWIDYDEECTEDKFNEVLAKSPFKRIYVSSTFNQDFLRLK